MKRIPIVNSNNYILCDDEDYEILAPYKWRVYFPPSRKGKAIIAAYITKSARMATPLFLLYGPGYHSYGVLFRDKNVYNYQRHNILFDAIFRKKPSISFYTAEHCPHGKAVLTKRLAEGKSQLCFDCAFDDYDNYRICLDAISHYTYWKGWIRKNID